MVKKTSKDHKRKPGEYHWLKELPRERTDDELLSIGRMIQALQTMNAIDRKSNNFGCHPLAFILGENSYREWKHTSATEILYIMGMTTTDYRRLCELHPDMAF